MFGSCCRPVLTTGIAPTAQRLMRSRFTAFALGDAAHLLRTWHPTTRPAVLDPDGGIEWRRLDVLDVRRGGPFDVEGIVEFVALYRQDGVRGTLHERSRFLREGRAWLYVDGVIVNQ
ncbi:YchJ family protein [Microbacterium soli]|uniref:YchJ family protein n=1 Tax=Microbacterium soli TaxID=446075 RepID=A0ABP7NI09_9MICO